MNTHAQDLSMPHTRARPVHADKRKEPDATGPDRSCCDAAVGALRLPSRRAAAPAPDALFECAVYRGSEAPRQAGRDRETESIGGSERAGARVPHAV